MHDCFSENQKYCSGNSILTISIRTIVIWVVCIKTRYFEEKTEYNPYSRSKEQ